MQGSEHRVDNVQELKIGQAQRLTAPSPFGLLSVLKPDGSTNLMAISWWTYLSNHPPLLGVCLSKKGLSGTLIEEQKEFAISIVGEDLKQPALECGRCSGRSCDKATEFDIPLEQASVIGAKTVCGSRVVFECGLVCQAEAGDHTFYIGEVVAIRGDESVKQLFAWDGYTRLDPL